MVMTIVTRNNRQRPKGELKAAIYSSALQLFREKGYGRATVDDVVAAAGVAKGTFFNFFSSKLAVMKAYYAAIDIEVAVLRSAMTPERPAESLRKYAAEVEVILLREGALMLELLDLVASDPAMRRLDAESGASDADGFASFLQTARSLDQIDADVDLAKASSMLTDLWSGAVRDWLRHPAPGALAESFGWRVDLFFRGLEPKS